MKKASKLISTLLTVAMVGTLLAGCGGRPRMDSAAFLRV